LQEFRLIWSSSNALPRVLLDAIVSLFDRAMPHNFIASRLFLHCQSRSAIMVDCCHVVDFVHSMEKGWSLISNCPPPLIIVLFAYYTVEDGISARPPFQYTLSHRIF
jgi:hypothetical protein